MSRHDLTKASLQARSNILQRLNQAKVVEKPKEAMCYTPWGEGELPDQNEKLARFITNMTANHTEVISVEKNALAETIRFVVSTKGLHSAVMGSAGHYHQYFVEGLSNIKTIIFDRAIEDWKTELFEDIDLGITHTLAGIADTGALVLSPSAEEPRTLSLVPPCHIAVVQASTIHCHLPEVMKAHNWANIMPTNALLISGPSKTADIQQTLAYGAHGPSQLVVVIVTDE
jgi:L-lactate dehydrogenase complex protein LldG